MQNLTKERKQPPVVILQQATSYNIFILCLWLRTIKRSIQGACQTYMHLELTTTHDGMLYKYS